MKQCSGILNRAANENGGRPGYIRNYNTKYYIFTGGKLLSTVNFWPGVEKFINSLDKSIIRVGTVLRMKNAICLYMAIMKPCSNPKAVPFRSEAAKVAII